MITVLVIALIGGIVCGTMIVFLRKKRDAAEQRAGGLQQACEQMRARIGELETELHNRHEVQQATDAQRQTGAYEQHTRLNELTGRKIELEMKWLESQTAAMAESRKRDEAWLEYHELMVEKTKLEMDSLRLYIQEQRKRLAGDDWNH